MNRYLTFVALFLWPIFFLSTEDDPFLDDSFLDDSFVEEDALEESSDEFIQDEIPFPSLNKVDEYIPSPVINTGLSLENIFSYSAQENRLLNRDSLFYISPIQNDLILNSFVNYRNADRWFSFNLNYQIFIQNQDQDPDLKESNWDFDNFIGFEITEAYLSFFLFNKVELSIGKMLFSAGSAYMLNPANPLIYTPGNNFTQARRMELPDYYSDGRGFPAPEYPRGSGRELGAWLISTTFDFTLLHWQIAYLPKMVTGFSEFDRPNNTLLTSLTYTQHYWFVPTIVFLYEDDNTIFFGTDLSLGIGDKVTIHAELGLSSKNELRYLSRNGKNDLYSNLIQKEIHDFSITQEVKDGLWVEAIIGINYTPSYKDRSLFTLLFEIYYNGKGLANDEWETYLENLNSLYDNYTLLKDVQKTPAAAYKGLAGESLRLYDVLALRPLYILLRINRDDLFSSFSSQVFNIDSSLVYSPFDSTFFWNLGLEWEGIRFISIGADFFGFFGADNGIFTIIDNHLGIEIYTTLHF